MRVGHGHSRVEGSGSLNSRERLRRFDEVFAECLASTPASPSCPALSAVAWCSWPLRSSRIARQDTRGALPVHEPFMLPVARRKKQLRSFMIPSPTPPKGIKKRKEHEPHSRAPPCRGVVTLLEATRPPVGMKGTADTLCADIEHLVTSWSSWQIVGKHHVKRPRAVSSGIAWATSASKRPLQGFGMRRLKSWRLESIGLYVFLTGCGIRAFGSLAT